MAQPSSTAFAPSQNTSRALHPTSLLASLTTLASSSLDDHINDYADAHRWIDSFFDKLQQRGPAARGAPRFVESFLPPAFPGVLIVLCAAVLPCRSS